MRLGFRNPRTRGNQPKDNGPSQDSPDVIDEDPWEDDLVTFFT